MTEIINLLLDVRVGLTILIDSIDFEIVKEELKKKLTESTLLEVN